MGVSAQGDNAQGSAPIDRAYRRAIQPYPFFLRRDSERRACDRVAMGGDSLTVVADRGFQVLTPANQVIINRPPQKEGKPETWTGG